MLIETLIKIIVVLGFICSMLYSLFWIDKIKNEIQPYYIKCAVFKALEWVDGEIPGAVTVGQYEKGVRIRAVPIKSERQAKSLSIQIDSRVSVKGKDNLAIALSPNGVLRAGTVEASDWTITFPPVVAKINVKR